MKISFFKLKSLSLPLCPCTCNVAVVLVFYLQNIPTVHIHLTITTPLIYSRLSVSLFNAFHLSSLFPFWPLRSKCSIIHMSLSFSPRSPLHSKHTQSDPPSYMMQFLITPQTLPLSLCPPFTLH